MEEVVLELTNWPSSLLFHEAQFTSLGLEVVYYDK